MAEFDPRRGDVTPQTDVLRSDLIEVGMDRRAALRLALLGVGAGALALAGCGDAEKEKPVERFASEPSWQQDFATMPDGPVDPSLWNIKLGPENYDGAGEQIYTDKPTNVAIRGGRLVITALEQTISGKPFTSARIDTAGNQSFGYGRMVIKARMPKGRGPHVGLWMRRAPKPGEEAGKPSEVYGEIDIAEHVGVNGDRIYANLHTNATRKAGIEGIVTQTDKDGTETPGCSDRFIEYTVERTAEGVAFFIDGKPNGFYKPPEGPNDENWPFGADDDYYLILNMAIGDRWGGKDGVDTESDPWQLEIEHAKFYPALT